MGNKTSDRRSPPSSHAALTRRQIATSAGAAGSEVFVGAVHAQGEFASVIR